MNREPGEIPRAEPSNEAVKSALAEAFDESPHAPPAANGEADELWELAGRLIGPTRLGGFTRSDIERCEAECGRKHTLAALRWALAEKKSLRAAIAHAKTLAGGDGFDGAKRAAKPSGELERLVKQAMTQ